jgi:hypothetical protein
MQLASRLIIKINATLFIDISLDKKKLIKKRKKCDKHEFTSPYVQSFDLRVLN